MYEIIDDTGQVVMIPSIMGITDETLVDILAWQFHVDFYDKAKDIEFRKQLVQLSIQWHMTKGTVQLVQDVLNLYFPGVATLQEWFQYKNPFPPNYPTDSADTKIATFATTAVDVTNNLFNVPAHGLTANQQVKFEIGSFSVGGRLPTPLVPDIYYYVANPTTNTFQVSPTQWHSGTGLGVSGSIIDLQDQGIGNNNEVWRRGTGSWHDRYRFRVLIDSQFIDPDDQAMVLALIDNYKPISRWMEGFVRAVSMECDIGWTGMLLRFIYRTSEAPTNYP
jgi:phage tail P2-like protein